jgi:DNA adenine methylase
MKSTNIPHPFPYQGSKRKIAPQIIERCQLSSINCVVESFAGTAAITLALLHLGIVDNAVINDKNEHIYLLWKEIHDNPSQLCDLYEYHWNNQLSDPKGYFIDMRNKLNNEYAPEVFLYILARIVKGAVRYSQKGMFSQSCDNRRLGMKPDKMRQNILSVSRLIKDRVSIQNRCYTDKDLYASDGANTLVYLDPPYQGVSFTADKRYIDGVAYEDFSNFLEKRLEHNPHIVISYDGMVGDRVIGKMLPETLPLDHYYINAGQSAQETLIGRSATTFESLYISKTISKTPADQSQLDLLVA